MIQNDLLPTALPSIGFFLSRGNSEGPSSHALGACWMILDVLIVCELVNTGKLTF